MSDASVVTTNGIFGSGFLKIGAVVNFYLRCSNASICFCPQSLIISTVFLVKSVKHAEIAEYPWINLL